jgi:hypothetical protein
MAYTNSSLVEYTRISPNRNSPRNQPIRKITVHHCAGVLTLEQFGNIVAPTSRQMSSNYMIDKEGRIGLFCPESDRSWCSSSPWNDHQAITIEVSNSANTDDWPIGEKAYNSLIKLCVDICKRNDIKKLEFTGDKNGSLTFHYFYASTCCPGPWMKAHAQDLCNKVNAQLNTTIQPVSSSTTAFKVGDLVSIKANAKYYTGEAIPAWVAAEKWYISSISGDRAVLGQNESKSRNIQSPVSTSSLVLVKSVTPVQSTGLYTKTLTAGTPIYAEIGKNATDKIATTTKYTIVEEKVVDYVKYGKLKSGVGWVIVEYLKRKFDIKNANDVKELQMTLTNKGFNCGAADGIVGDNTINAMFQALCEQWLQIKK